MVTRARRIRIEKLMKHQYMEDSARCLESKRVELKEEMLSKCKLQAGREGVSLYH